LSYDEGVGLEFRQNFTTISFNVTAVAQDDPSGVGPAYLLNGLTDKGYWYQVGVSWDWGGLNLGYYSGFKFVYQVWNTNLSQSVFPAVGVGLAAFNGTVNPGDEVLLSLSFGPGYDVVMQASDASTHASASIEYASYGAETFIGSDAKPGFFGTGLLTEWYHNAPSFCSDRKVIYSNTKIILGPVWVNIHEFNLSCYTTCQALNSTENPYLNYFFGFQPFNLNSSSFQSYTGLGTAIYANEHEFVTM
jgi:hypothetical protein